MLRPQSSLCSQHRDSLRPCLACFSRAAGAALSLGDSREHGRHRHDERCDRPHADGAELPARPAPPGERGPDARRRQGNQHRPRAEAARRSRRRDRPRRRAHRHADRRGAHVRGDPERLRRIDDESRTSTAIVDPTGGSYTELNEWGPHVSGEELQMLLEKLVYLSQGADYVVFAGSLPRGIDDDFYAEAVHELNRRGAQTILDSEGEPLRLGVQAEPLLVSPNEREAEALVGQEFNDDDDFLTGLETIAEMGARNVLITSESGCWALLRAERHASH